MSETELITLPDVLGPLGGALAFILLMSCVPEPTRRHYNAIFVAGASAAYLSGGGFGVWELPYIAVAGGVVSFLGLSDYKYIGLAWFMHAGWDAVHHLYGNPLWPFMAMSSFGCAIFDSAIAVWFLAGAPTWVPSWAQGLSRPRRPLP